MKIIFISSPPVSKKMFCMVEDCCVNARGVPILPSMLLNAASVAKKHGHKVRFVDASIENVSRETTKGFDAIVFPLMLRGSDVTANYIKNISSGQKIIAFCSPPGYASDFSNMYKWIDALVYAEQELAVSLLPDSAKGFSSWVEKTKGVISKDKQEYNYPKTVFSRIAYTDFSIIPRGYFDKYRSAIYQVTRGCPYKCTFCLWGGSTVTDTAYSVRKAVDVSEDMDKLQSFAGRKIPMYLLAAQLTTSRTWVKRFADSRRGKVYKYNSNFNLSELTEEKIDLLAASGLTCFVAGMEAVSNKCLSMLKKPHTFEDICNSIRMLEKKGCNYRFHLRYGFGESDEDIKESIACLREMMKLVVRKSVFDIGPLVHYKGTDIYENAKYKLVKHPQSKADILIDGNVNEALLGEFYKVLSNNVRVVLKRPTSSFKDKICR